jgi:hypothetical protein
MCSCEICGQAPVDVPFGAGAGLGTFVPPLGAGASAHRQHTAVAAWKASCQNVVIEDAESVSFLRVLVRTQSAELIDIGSSIFRDV